MLSAQFAVEPEQSRLRIYGGVGGGIMISEDQLGWLGYDGIAGRSWFTIGHALTERWILEGHGSGGVFGSSGRDGGLFEIGAGFRYDLLTGMHWIRVVPAAHLNMGITGGQVRPTVSVSVGLLLDLSRAWAMGPNLQYGQVFQPDGDRYSSDARYFSFGVAVGYRPFDEPTPPPGAAEDSEPEMMFVERDDDRDPPPDVAPSPELMVLIESAVPQQVLHIDESKLLPPVLFEHDSTDFIPCGEASLFYVRDAINQRKDDVVLEGHADTTGALGYNVNLALRRAEVVQRWLAEHGVDPARMRVESHGEHDNLTPETDDTRRQINRRVIIRFEGPKADAGAAKKPAKASAKPSDKPSAPAPAPAPEPMELPFSEPRAAAEAAPAPADPAPAKPAPAKPAPTPAGAPAKPAAAPAKPAPQPPLEEATDPVLDMDLLEVPR